MLNVHPKKDQKYDRGTVWAAYHHCLSYSSVSAAHAGARADMSRLLCGQWPQALPPKQYFITPDALAEYTGLKERFDALDVLVTQWVKAVLVRGDKQARQEQAAASSSSGHRVRPPVPALTAEAYLGGDGFASGGGSSRFGHLSDADKALFREAVEAKGDCARHAATAGVKEAVEVSCILGA